MFTIIVKGLIIRERKILIIRRNLKQEIGPGAWELVGGNLEGKETLEEGLLREIKEETSIDCTIHRLLYATDHNIGEGHKMIIIVYLCRPLTNQVVLSDEHIDYKWVDLGEFRKLVSKQILKDLDRYSALDIEELKEINDIDLDK